MATTGLPPGQLGRMIPVGDITSRHAILTGPSLLLTLGLALAAFGPACRMNDAPAEPVSATVREFAAIRDGRTARSSSWDRTGGNKDCVTLEAGETKVLAEVAGPGSIQRVYIGTTTPQGAFLRELVLRMHWDGAEQPCVEVPLGDFFLTGYEAFVRTIQTTFVVVNPGSAGLGSHGYVAYFPMPFRSGARITLENQGRRRAGQFCFHIEFESYSTPLPRDIGRFHAQWRRQTTVASSVQEADRNKVQWGGKNQDGKDNYVILEAEGKGHLIGLQLNIDNAQPGWYGEGDDMIFIDGETWPPSYHGTGTEEIFGGGACPDVEYSGPYSGFHLTENRGGERFAGKVSMYRWYVHDPIRFARSLRWTLEHGHANNYENDYSSVAYWYQFDPHGPFPHLPPPSERLPRMPEEYLQARELILSTQQRLPQLQSLAPQTAGRLRNIRREGHRLFQEGHFAEALARFQFHAKELEKLGVRGR